MSLSKKYGIDEDKIKQLIKDGWLNCSVTKYEQIYNAYRQNLSTGISKPQAISNAAEIGRVSERAVYYIIHKFE